MTTSITIELTDEQVAELRRWAWANPPSRQRAVMYPSIGFAQMMVDALPPEPIKLTIDVDQQTKLDGTWFPGEHTLTLSECNVLRAASVALKREAFADAMSDGLCQSKAQGMPLK